MSTTTTAPDLETIKARQQKTWASGDYSAIAARISLISERLCDAADLRAGWRVLDIAGGSGNTALAAARLGAEVVTLDYVPALLDRACERAAAEGLAITTVEGDAEALPFPDASFDAVISAVGVMFAPDHARTAAEMLRVCRPGGTVAMANWTPDGFIGGLFSTTGAYVPPPAGVTPPPLWGTEDHVRGLLGDGVRDMRATRRTFTFRERSPEAFVDLFRTYYGPTHMAFGALDGDDRDGLYSALTSLVRRHDVIADDEAVACPADYLEVIATRV